MDRSWEELGRTLGGSFSARVRGLISPEVVLSAPQDETLGQLVGDGAGGRRVRLGGVSARIEAPIEGTYRMMTEDAELLVARGSGPATDLHLKSGPRTYEASISIPRNEAVARLPDGTETARVSGGLTNRRFGATFDPEDPASLPVAIFLLDRLLTLRRSAFRARG